MKDSIILIIVFGLLFLGCTQSNPETSPMGVPPPAPAGPIPSPETSPSPVEPPAVSSETSPLQHSPPTYQGERIAGSTTPYLRYNEADFNRARSEGKTIYLYFYATWCPICAAERPDIFSAFNQMAYDNVVGFEVHYNDPETTDEDRAITRALGVPYQHTTIILNDEGEEAYRSLSPISSGEIRSAITEARS
ncbi:MAG TPA: hypothetical protein VJH24_02625 [Candidatus Bilamarchaeaceae archaeon]|nr:hypothetical protein [Candidatus Bilamarchaeaceae archaeon]